MTHPLVDCVIVNDELDLLEARLEYLSGHGCDTFVIVEAREDFRGRRKPAHVEASTLLERFAAYDIHHVVLGTLPTHGDDEIARAWGRERSQRNAITEGLHDVPPDAVVMLLDVDEFPSPRGLADLRRVSDAPVSLRMVHCVGYANLRTRHPWDSPVAVPRHLLVQPHALRRDMGARSGVVEQGGWHFSYLGGERRQRDKFAVTPHVELDQGWLKNPVHLAICHSLGCHPATTWKLLDRFDPAVLPKELLVEQVIAANVMERRGFARAVAASCYSSVVSVFVGENWRLRNARDRQRALRRRLHGVREPAR